MVPSLKAPLEVPSTKTVAGSIVTLVAFVAAVVFRQEVQLDETVVVVAVGLAVNVAHYFRSEKRAPDSVTRPYEVKIARLEAKIRQLEAD